MYKHIWDNETGGYIITTNVADAIGSDIRPVYYKELDILGLDKYWDYPKDESAPLMWAEANRYYYHGICVAKTIGGSLFTKPELEVFEDNLVIKPVDIEAMINKTQNKVVMESIVNDTLKNIYEEYTKYKKTSIDVFYVAFSGGKDSVVTLDLVARALPSNEFIAVFGDTGMELSDTYNLMEKMSNKYPELEFHIAKSKHNPIDTWNAFGPPARTIRWCCSVHKTSPQIGYLRNRIGKPDFKGMAFTGIRREESLARSGYEQITNSKKHIGQFSFHPILEWGSAEVYMYIFMQGLLLNEAYKKGNSRVGCLVCPMSSGRHEYMKKMSYSSQMEPYINCIKNTSSKNFITEERMNDFIDNGGWQKRKSGKELNISCNPIMEKKGENFITFLVKVDRKKLIEWLKTVGDFISTNTDNYVLKRNGKYYKVLIDNTCVKLYNLENTKADIKTLSLFRSALRKAVYCIGCQVCEINCPYGYIELNSEGLTIKDECKKCGRCHEIEYGCLAYYSKREPKGESKNMKGIDRYLTFGFHKEWLAVYLQKEDLFWQENSLGTKMIQAFKRFLRDAELMDKNSFSHLANEIKRIGVNDNNSWLIIFNNLSYTPQFAWYVRNIEFNKRYIPEEIKDMLGEDVTQLQKRNIVGAFKNIFYYTPFGDELKIGLCEFHEKIKGKKKSISLVSTTRLPMKNIDARVVLYSLYVFAEACNGYYRFTLSALMDVNVEREGLTPAQLFGLERDEIEGIVNGLSISYPDFIKSTFTHDLESIVLNEEKTSVDVVDLF